MPRAVFLDRDGVLNRAIIRNGRPYPPSSAEECEILPGVDTACGLLRAAGFLLIVVTNQPDISRGSTTLGEVEAINNSLRQALPLHAVLVCPHDDSEQCGCRKPKPGLLLSAAKEYAVNLSDSFMVGDRWRDIAAGQTAGCRTIWIDGGYREQRPEAPDLTVFSLLESVDWIIQTQAVSQKGRIYAEAN